MNQKRQYKTYTKVFKEEAVALVIDQGYTVPDAAESLGIRANLLYGWKQQFEDKRSGNILNTDERSELMKLRKENKQLRMEKRNFKKGQCLLRKRNEVKFNFIKKNEGIFPVKKQCEVMSVSRSGYYAWLNRPAKIISESELILYRRTKALFKESRQSLGSRQLMKNLRKEGFVVGRDKVIRLMDKLGLQVKQRIAYKVTTMRKHSHSVADNIVDQQFNPKQANQIWAGDVTYLRTGQGWMYLAIVMDLYSRRIIGWAIHKRMTVDLVERAMQMALNLRQPTKELIFHSDRGSQYTSHRFQQQLKNNNITASMSGRGACLDNAVVERFFGSLKNEWLLNIYHLTRCGMKEDVEAYIRYYNQIRLHTSNGDCSPIEFEQSTINVSYAA